MFVWKKRVPPTDAEIWIERLSFMGPERVAIVEPVNARSPRVEVYCDSEADARLLAEAFGGEASEVLDAQWQPSPATAPGKPLSIAGRLLITGRSEELEILRAKHPKKDVLCIPAAMAFGTGEHATTAMCLRLLAEISRRQPPGAWELLDLGSGSGVLALAGRLFGAKKALGLDNDPHAVRTAKENAASNGVSAVQFKKADLVNGWEPERTWPVIAANLFSELFIGLLPKIDRALAAGGQLVISGILAQQAADVEKALLAPRVAVADQTAAWPLGGVISGEIRQITSGSNPGSQAGNKVFDLLRGGTNDGPMTSPAKQPKGPWLNRFAIRAFTLLLGVLIFWLLGFFVNDIASLEGPTYEAIEARHLDKGLLEKQAAQEAQLAELSRKVENQTELQRLLGTSTQNLQQTIGQLLDLQKQGLEKNVAFSDKEQANVTSSLNLFLENQKKYQESNQTLSEMLRQKQAIEDEKQRLEQQLESERQPARQEYEILSARHRWKLACLQLAVLLPLLGIGATLAIKKRGSIYYPLYLAFGGAVLFKVGLVIHEYFPSRYFHYVLIAALIMAVVRLLIHFIWATAFPKAQSLLKQSREAYERFLCPVCEYPIRTGPRRFLFWTRRTVNKLVVPNPVKEEEEKYICPSCGTPIFEECPSCHKIRHTLLPHCEHCGAEKILAVQEVTAAK